MPTAPTSLDPEQGTGGRECKFLFGGATVRTDGRMHPVPLQARDVSCMDEPGCLRWSLRARIHRTGRGEIGIGGGGGPI